MNRRPPRPTADTAADAAKVFDDPAVQREWALQERARQEERRGAPMAADDPRLGEYRLLARALRTPAMEPVPEDFAAQVARRVEAASAVSDRFEQWLQQALLAALAFAAIGVAMGAEPQWWPGLAEWLRAAPPGWSNWGMVAAVSCALAWGTGEALRAFGIESRTGRARAG